MILDLFSDLFNFILECVVKLANIILLPIENIIFSLLPDFSNILSYVSGFFNWLCGLIPWVVSYLGLDQPILAFASYVLVFRLTASITAYAIKLAIKWYNYLKP